MARRNTNTAKKNEQAQVEQVQEVQEVASTAPTASPEAKQTMQERIDAVSIEGMTTKSAKIRAYAAAGIPTADIARHLQIKYQHVRNVLVQPAPKAKETTEEVAATA